MNTIGREFDEQDRVPDHIEGKQNVERDGSDFMSDIEYLHPLLGEQKQHVQGRVSGAPRIRIEFVPGGCSDCKKFDSQTIFPIRNNGVN